jgi:SAM-dependent methyltransferase
MGNRYDEVPYVGMPFDQTHPDRLATIARLFGMTPAAPGECRMLELGCGDGGNLIPLAYSLPGSAFVGIDAAAVEIAKGAALVRDLGQPNIELRHADLLATAGLGRFDYIVAHGVYSWTPPPVQERILSICRESLAPQGVAYISYSVYPGAHVGRMISEMMRDHALRFADPQQQIEQARAFVAFLAKGRKDNDPYAALLREKLDRLLARHPGSIFHDELAEYHEPVYFREFAARAARHGLQYLGEADFHEMQDCMQPPETVAELRRIAPGLIEREQHLDYLKCRRFRQTLLCRDEVALDRGISSSQMRRFLVCADKLREEGVPAITEHPMAAEMNRVLQEAWPAALSFDELLGAIRERAGVCSEDDLALQDLVLAHAVTGLVELQSARRSFALAAGDRPRASALARAQLRAGPVVTNLIHRPVLFEDEPSRALLAAMDGARDRAALLEAARRALGERSAEATLDELDRRIREIARLALLEA